MAPREELHECDPKTQDPLASNPVRGSLRPSAAGRGPTRFNVLSELSVCGACGGLGTLSVPVPHQRCAYCEGTGSFKTFRCPVCEGAGVIAAMHEPTKTCSSCDGLAFERFELGWSSLTCKGRGVVPA